MAVQRKKKTRSGRPRRHPNPLSKVVLLRLTPFQYKALQQKAADLGQTVPEMIRMVLHAELITDEEWEG